MPRKAPDKRQFHPPRREVGIAVARRRHFTRVLFAAQFRSSARSASGFAMGRGSTRLRITLIAMLTKTAQHFARALRLTSGHQFRRGGW